MVSWYAMTSEQEQKAAQQMRWDVKGLCTGCGVDRGNGYIVFRNHRFCGPCWAAGWSVDDDNP